MRTAESVVFTHWPPGAAGAVHVDAQVVLVDVDLHLVRFGQHGHRCRGRVDAALALGFRYALHAVHAALEFHDRVHLVALDFELDLLEAAGFGRRHVHRLGLPALRACETFVHLVEVACKEGCLVAAGCCADLHDDVLVVGWVGRNEHELDILFERRQLSLDLGDFLLRELLHVRVGEHLLCRSQIVGCLHVLGRLVRERPLARILLCQAVVFLLVCEHGGIAHTPLQVLVGLDDLDKLFSHIGFLHVHAALHHVAAHSAGRVRGERPLCSRKWALVLLTGI